jgi:hypothetical protein
VSVTFELASKLSKFGFIEAVSSTVDAADLHYDAWQAAAIAEQVRGQSLTVLTSK